MNKTLYHKIRSSETYTFIALLIISIIIIAFAVWVCINPIAIFFTFIPLGLGYLLWSIKELSNCSVDAYKRELKRKNKTYDD